MNTAHNTYVYDIETLLNCHTAVFEPVDSTDRKIFVIHESRDDREEYMKFLMSDGLKLIGFNNINFDYQVLHRLITGRDRFPFIGGTSEQLSSWIHSISQSIINEDVTKVPAWNMIIPQRDLFLIHHFNNKARRTSLKMLEIAMQMPNVQDMPIGHNEFVNAEQVEEIIQYNINDVIATKDFYKASQNEITMRREIGRYFGIDVMNDNDPKIGEKILLTKISESMNMSLRDVKELSTTRKYIDVKKIILPYIKFETKAFKKVLNDFKMKTINVTQTKDAFSMSMVMDGMIYDFGFGGLHAIRYCGIFKQSEETEIMSADVSSYYPNLAVQNKFYPEHLGEHFCDVYSELYYKRKEYPKGSAANYGMKIALNGVYGKSNDEYSPLYDPKMTMQITINGQLLLAMLCEMFTLKGFTVLMVNTDGVEVIIPRNKRDIYDQVCREWEEMTKLTLEHTSYRALFIRDVNNYIGQFSNGDVYLKGDYEIEKQWHKDHSMKIVPIAVKNYFINNIPVMDTLKKHDNIYDFMVSAKTRSDSTFILRTLHDGVFVDEPLPKTNRLLVVNKGKGGYLLKKFDDGKMVKMYKDWKLLPCNNLLSFTDEELKNLWEYVDYRFYAEQANKLIRPLIYAQTDLFK